MKYGIREICNVVFRATATMMIGSRQFKKGQPVLFMESAKTSTLESAATAVYATGGRGNTRLVTWEGEKTLTFTVEDALLSPISFAMLSGAGVVSGQGNEQVHFHMTSRALMDKTGKIDLENEVDEVKAEGICKTAPLYIMKMEEDGSITGELYEDYAVSEDGKTIIVSGIDNSETVIIDYYVKKKSAQVKELQIDAEHFGGTFYVEADTLFRAEKDGQDYPANITIPKAKIQTNWTFSMASSGDPSTFSFVMDAMPGFTHFNKTKKVLCAIQIIEDVNAANETYESVMEHKEDNEGDASQTAVEDLNRKQYTQIDIYSDVESNQFKDTDTYYVYQNGEFVKVSKTEGNLYLVAKNDNAGTDEEPVYTEWRTDVVVYKKNS